MSNAILSFSHSSRNGYYPLDVVDELEAATMPKVEAWMATKKTTNNCTLGNAIVRQEWYVLARDTYLMKWQVGTW